MRQRIENALTKAARGQGRAEKLSPGQRVLRSIHDEAHAARDRAELPGDQSAPNEREMVEHVALEVLGVLRVLVRLLVHDDVRVAYRVADEADLRKPHHRMLRFWAWAGHHSSCFQWVRKPPQSRPGRVAAPGESAVSRPPPSRESRCGGCRRNAGDSWCLGSRSLSDHPPSGTR
jgi:hypothetical protein